MAKNMDDFLDELDALCWKYHIEIKPTHPVPNNEYPTISIINGDEIIKLVYIDGDGIGLNIPFLNDSHYPFKEVRMIQFPTRRNVSDLETDLINDPITDDCE
jgi:hypothetical protein